MKTDHRCPKCGSTRVGHFSTVMDDIGAITGVPRRLADARASGTWNAERLIVEVEAYVCTGCGYFEEYVKEPGSVQWDEIEGFTLLDRGA